MAQQKLVRLSKSEADSTGAEGVYATISAYSAKGQGNSPSGETLYSYKMFGTQLHGPIPAEARAGFKSAEEAEHAARREYQEWRAGNVPPGVMVTRQEYWEMHYRQEPYLQHLTADQLAKRFRDVTNNLMTIEKDQTIGFIPMNEQGDYWSAAIAHIYEEYRLRGGIPVQDTQQLIYPTYDWPGVDNALAKVTAMGLVPGQYLVRYSKYKYLKEALEKGKIRINPATTYRDQSLNRAVKDDELALTLYPHQSAKEATSLAKLRGDLKNLVQSVGPVIETLTAPTNYYVYCMTSEFALRLFADFEADACLIVTKPRVFVERLLRGGLDMLPGWTAFGVGVHYVDPAIKTEGDIDILYSKDFSFAYQKEYRLIWKPPTPETVLNYIEVEIGNLEDCCELISLRD
jgi:hypothetical protein